MSAPGSPAPGVAGGRSGVGTQSFGSDRSGKDGSGDLSASLAALIAHPEMPAAERRFEGEDVCDRCTPALKIADLLLADGWGRVTGTPVTVDDIIEQVARMVQYHDCDAAEDGPCRQYDEHRRWHIATAQFAVLAARAALRGGEQR